MRGFYVLLGSLSLPVILVCVFTGGGYRINLTASQPLGLWQVAFTGRETVSPTPPDQAWRMRASVCTVAVQESRINFL